MTFAFTHIDLHFFYDIDIVLLTVGIAGTDLSLYDCEDTMYRFARAYPAGWEDNGEGLHCMFRVEWLASDGTVLATSDTEQQQKFLSFVAQHRLPRISAHWAFLLKPLV